MKIGFLHSIVRDLPDTCNAKLYRVGYEQWKANPKGWFFNTFYGQYTTREKLRGQIYEYRKYIEEFKGVNDYDLIFLSLNFDTYPSDFHKFVTDVIQTLCYFIDDEKQIIIGAGNEVFEKRRSVEKVIQTTWDVAQGIKNSSLPGIPICGWNQKVRTADEKEAYQKVCKNKLMKTICRYIGIQSLGTKEGTLSWAISGAKREGYELIDVELGTIDDGLGKIKWLFETDRVNGVEIVFILCPYCSTSVTDKRFKEYALSIGMDFKAKFEIIEYASQFKDKKEEGISDMLNFAIDKKCLLRGSKGEKVRLLQKLLNYWNGHSHLHFAESLDEDGDYGELTEKAVETFQHWTKEYWLDGLVVDGVAGRNTIKTLIALFLNMPIKVTVSQGPSLDEQVKKLDYGSVSPGTLIV